VSLHPFREWSRIGTARGYAMSEAGPPNPATDLPTWRIEVTVDGRCRKFSGYGAGISRGRDYEDKDYGLRRMRLAIRAIQRAARGLQWAGVGGAIAVRK
jgi:hypothetical protein